jgi:hypothetical protein
MCLDLTSTSRPQGNTTVFKHYLKWGGRFESPFYFVDYAVSELAPGRTLISSRSDSRLSIVEQSQQRVTQGLHAYSTLLDALASIKIYYDYDKTTDHYILEMTGAPEDFVGAGVFGQ